MIKIINVLKRFKATLIQNYGQPNYYSPTSAWGEVYMYKIGNKKCPILY
ncbi:MULTISPECIES: hypothetical protein [Staphylococcus]|nr:MULTISPECIES: hypothetical protein [Staphylococcus]PYE04168.1 hypothetical protein BDW31_1276 [Staphylococcus sp. AtHG25]QTK09228.1 hypothetical protein J2N82_11745 [Staphylococcus haemolyticus]QTK11401.1 hypothetical protein J2N84_11760 [Staphylococcus haemolyticus]QTK13589.1 hypothetical protein J2N83_11750 [Staphylococcus haemolyticus]